MGRRINILVILSSLFAPTTLKADGQDILVWVSDGADFIFVFSIWTASIFVLLLIVKAIRKKEFNKRQKLIIWASGLLLAFFHWNMIKYDPYPYSGPIDSFIYRNKIEKKRINDSRELINGKPDSTIETTISSIDTNEVGVYIWLNHKKIFVRKLTPQLNWRQNDSLTMSIVQSWKKK